MTRQITLHEPCMQELTKEQVLVELNAILNTAKEKLTNIEMCQEIMRVLDIHEVRKVLSDLRSGKYL